MQVGEVPGRGQWVHKTLLGFVMAAALFLGAGPAEAATLKSGNLLKDSSFSQPITRTGSGGQAIPGSLAWFSGYSSPTGPDSYTPPSARDGQAWTCRKGPSSPYCLWITQGDWIYTDKSATPDASVWVRLEFWAYKEKQPTFKTTSSAYTNPSGVMGLHVRYGQSTTVHDMYGIIDGSKVFLSEFLAQPVGTWRKYSVTGPIPAGARNVNVMLDEMVNYDRVSPDSPATSWLYIDQVYLSVDGSQLVDPPAAPTVVTPTAGADVTSLTNAFKVVAPTGATSLDVVLSDENGGAPWTATLTVAGGQEVTFGPDEVWRANHTATGFMNLGVAARNSAGSSQQTVVQFRYNPWVDVPTTDPAYGIQFDQANPWEPIAMPNNLTVAFNGAAYIGKVFSIYQDGIPVVRDEPITQRSGSNVIGGTWPLTVNLSEGLHTIRVVVNEVDGAGIVSETVYAEKTLSVNYVQVRPAPATCHDDANLGLFEKGLCWAFVPQGYYLIEWNLLQQTLATKMPTAYVAAFVSGMTSFKDGAAAGWDQGWRFPYGWWDGAGGVTVKWATISLADSAWATVYDVTRLISRAVFLGWLLVWGYRKSQQFLQA